MTGPDTPWQLLGQSLNIWRVYLVLSSKVSAACSSQTAIRRYGSCVQTKKSMSAG